jgi:hypothetical protein
MKRIDSLFFSVLLGYFHHLQPGLPGWILRPVRNRVALSILAAACLFPCLIVPVGTAFMLTLGLTLLYFGFGIVLMIYLTFKEGLRLAPPKMGLQVQWQEQEL